MYSETTGGARKICTPSFEFNGITSKFSRCSLRCQMPQTAFQNQKGPEASKSHSPSHGYLIPQSTVLFGLVNLVILHANSHSNNIQVFCFQTSLSPKLFSRTYKLCSSLLLTSASSSHGKDVLVGCQSHPHNFWSNQFVTNPNSAISPPIPFALTYLNVSWVFKE